MGGWRKSSHSNSQGACVEVAAGWRKSRRSVNHGACAEVGQAGRAVTVRDTTDRDAGPVLEFPPAAWAAFTLALKG